MGFPNEGMKEARKNLEIIKNKPDSHLCKHWKKQRHSIDQASEDYKLCLKELNEVSDVFVINISSPNTKNLRDIFDKDNLKDFLSQISSYKKKLNLKQPSLLKLSPDMETLEEMQKIVDEALSQGIDGFILTNSTRKREIPNLFPVEGGISGDLLKKRSLFLLESLKKYLDDKEIKDKLIVSCGGVLNEKDILERLDRGASLVQVYSALVFEGPLFFRKVFTFNKKEEIMYIDGLVFAVPTKNKQAFIDYSKPMNDMMKGFGCQRIVYAWGEQVLDGKITDFKQSVQATKEETVVFAWHEWPDKATRDKAHQEMRKARSHSDQKEKPPFDGMRMIFGGFESFIESEKDKMSSNLKDLYIDGMIFAVPRDKKKDFINYAKKSDSLIEESPRIVYGYEVYSALVPEGLIFLRKSGWVEWPNKEVRSLAQKNTKTYGGRSFSFLKFLYFFWRF